MKYHGQGTMTYANGKVKNGIWENGLFIQEIVEEKESGPVFKTIHYPKGGKYTGYVDENGKRSRKGTYTSATGEIRQGIWVNDHMTGKGVLIDTRGWKYEGEFKNSNRHGEGKLYDNKGKLRTTGVWENNNLRKEYK